MAEVEEISLLIGDIYDASLDSSLWPNAFAGIRGFLGDCTASLVSQTITKAVDLHFMLGHDPAYVDSFLDRYFKINPIFPPVMFLDVERTHVLADVVPLQEFCRSRFAQEWLAPQGICDGALSTVEKSAAGCTAFMTMRRSSDGSCGDEFRRRFGLLVPHVRRALLIGNVINRHKVEAAALADSLDTLTSGMFIVNETGRIIHANISGYAMVAEASVLRAPNGRLRASDAAADQAFLDIFTAAGGGDAVLGRKGIAVPLKARDGDRYIAHVLPLTSGARRKAGISYGAVASIFVRKAAIDLPPPPVALAREFQLTPAELRVLFSIVENSGVSEVADILGITEATVRTHLHRLYEKTSTARQADLVKLVAGYCVAP
jgi:DNA-binding CsgD family transcriptional regulator